MKIVLLGMVIELSEVDKAFKEVDVEMLICGELKVVLSTYP